MAYTKSVTICGIAKDNYEYFKQCLASSAAVGSVGFHIHEHKNILSPGINLGLARFGERQSYDVIVDVWSDNPGTLDDYCEFFLGGIAEQRPSYHTIYNRTIEYRDRVKNWCGNQ